MTSSSFHKDRTIEEVARKQYRSLWQEARDKKLTPSDAYGEQEMTARQFTLSGGGPGSDITILVDSDGDAKEGFYSYYEAQGSHVIPIEPHDAQMMLDRLTGNYNEDEDEDEDEDEEVDG